MTTNRGIEIAEEYLTFRSSEMAGTNVDLVILFGNLLYDMEEYNRSQKYFENLLTNRGNDRSANNIGKAYYKKCDYDKAIHHFEKTMQVYAHAWPDYHQQGAIPLNHLVKFRGCTPFGIDKDFKCNYQTTNRNANQTC
ncbi:unnamed protein product [Rotaria sordida]|nr:unnamed protein product [Rotaria sordida]